MYRFFSGPKRDDDEPDLTLLDKFRIEPGAESERAHRITEALIREIRDACRRRGTRLLVAVLPDRAQIQDEVWSELLGGVDAGDYRRTRPSEVCLEICGRLGVESLDLLPALKATHRSGVPVFLPRDIHWSPAGHQIAAGALRDRLLELGWLPRPR